MSHPITTPTTTEPLAEAIAEQLSKKVDTATLAENVPHSYILFKEIMKISLNARDQAVTKASSHEKATLSVSVNHNVTPEEVQLTMRIDTRSLIKRVLNLGKTPVTQILILTTEGYRMATPKTLNDHYRTRGQGDKKIETPNVTPYSNHSFAQITSFLTTFNTRLKAALKIS